jgi:hypothetical protein
MVIMAFFFGATKMKRLLFKLSFFFLFASMSSSAYSLDPKKCFKTQYGPGFLMSYEFPGYSSAEYLTKKHGFFGGTTVNSAQSTVALVDPGVTTGRFLSSTEFTSTEGGCSYFSSLEVERIEYLARNQSEVKEAMAFGKGEHLRSLFYYSLCRPGAYSDFTTELQKNYDQFELLQNEKDMNRLLNLLIRDNKVLNQACWLS